MKPKLDTGAAVVTAGAAFIAVVFAIVAAERQADISERLLRIEEERNHARLQVLPNLYRTVDDSPDEPAVLITVANIGLVIGGPISVSVAADDGEDLSFGHQDPQFIQPGEMATFFVYLIGNQGLEAFDWAIARRGGSDFPESMREDTWRQDWAPADLKRGYFIRAWDPTTGRNWWYPRPPDKEPPGPPEVL